MTQDELIDLVQLDIPDAPRASIRDQMQRMARELCQDANAMVASGIVVVGAKSGYPQLLVPNDSEPLRILELMDGQCRLAPGRHYSQPAPGQVMINGNVSNDTLTGKVACRPKYGTDIPESLLTEHGDTIANGARWRLLLMPQPWMNPELASYYQQSYQAGVVDAQRRHLYGHAKGSASIRLRKFV